MTPEQQEIAQKNKEIEELTQQIIDIEMTHAQEYLEINRFAFIFQQQIAPLYERLERWKLRLKAASHMMEKLFTKRL